MAPYSASTGPLPLASTERDWSPMPSDTMPIARPPCELVTLQPAREMVPGAAAATHTRLNRSQRATLRAIAADAGGFAPVIATALRC